MKKSRIIRTYLLIIYLSLLSISALSQQNIVAGSFTDPRDGQTYKTIKIMNQIWFC